MYNYFPKVSEFATEIGVSDQDLLNVVYRGVRLRVVDLKFKSQPSEKGVETRKALSRLLDKHYFIDEWPKHLLLNSNRRSVIVLN